MLTCETEDHLISKRKYVSVRFPSGVKFIDEYDPFEPKRRIVAVSAVRLRELGWLNVSRDPFCCYVSARKGHD